MEFFLATTVLALLVFIALPIVGLVGLRSEDLLLLSTIGVIGILFVLLPLALLVMFGTLSFPRIWKRA